jgi:hypothetical protein
MMVLTITCNRFVAAINDVYYTVLDDLIEGLNAIDCFLVMHILTTYAQISQPDLDDNMTNFYPRIDLGLPLNVYTRKQEKCQVFAVDARVPISKETIITTGTKHALLCSNKSLAWHKWKHRPHPDHIWPNWKTHRTAAFTEMCSINRMTAGDTSFGANQATKLDQAQQMASSLDNLANVTIQKNTAIKNLVATNAMLIKAIADIQLYIARMCAAGVPTSHATTSPAPLIEARVCPSHWSITKLAWDEVRYCWTHGYKVKVGHNSSSYCSLRKTCHQPGMTRANIMDGSTYNTGYPTTTTPPT